MKYVVASNRIWNRRLPQALAARVPGEFAWIGGPEELTVQHLNDIGPRYIFFPHWSFMIPRAIYEAYECVVFHMTDVPYGRGGSPLQNLIVRGASATKISALRCTSEIDAGPVYAKADLCLAGNAEEIYLRASRVIEDMIVHLVAEEPVPVPQEGDPVTFVRRTPEESSIAELSGLDAVFDHIRMLDAQGYPHAFLDVGSLRMEFTRAARYTDEVRADVRITRREQGGES